jgi:hypothetical protein
VTVLARDYQRIRGPGPYGVLFAAEGELDLAFEDGEHLLEVVPVRRRASAVGDVHVH